MHRIIKTCSWRGRWNREEVSDAVSEIVAFIFGHYSTEREREQDRKREKDTQGRIREKEAVRAKTPSQG